MKETIIAISAILLIGSITPFAIAEGVPSWVKNNAGWWAEGTITETEFVSGIQHLIKEGTLVVPPTTVSDETTQQGIPSWVKNNAGWWADGVITDEEFVNGIQHMIKIGIINVPTSQSVTSQQESNMSSDSELVKLQAELDKCSEIVTAYKRIDCEKPIKKAMILHTYKMSAEKFDLGPITYYWKGLGSEGNEFEITPTGQAILSIRMLAENTSSETTAINCTSPQICAYDVWNGEKAFKYSGMDFTSGQIVMNPGDSREFNMLFGPNIGYGGTEFEHDSSKDYFFRINEDFGNTSIPLNLG